MSRMDDLLDFIKKFSEFGRTYQRNNLKYASIDEFIIKNGRPFDGSISEARIHGRRGKPKQCFYNAWRLMDERDDLIYVEGRAAGIIPVMHAWCVDREGNVYEPTWRLTGNEVYYGVPFKRRFVLTTAVARGYYGIIDDMEQGFPMLRGDVERNEYLETIR